MWRIKVLIGLFCYQWRLPHTPYTPVSAAVAMTTIPWLRHCFNPWLLQRWPFSTVFFIRQRSELFAIREYDDNAYLPVGSVVMTT